MKNNVHDYFKNYRLNSKKYAEGSLKSSNRMKPLEIPVTEGTIFFNSRFESGNLEQVYKISTLDYSLYLKEDTHNSNHTTQWFYFSVG
jgi:hypothetical protein